MRNEENLECRQQLQDKWFLAGQFGFASDIETMIAHIGRVVQQSNDDNKMLCNNNKYKFT